MKKIIWILLGASLLWNCDDNDGGVVAPEGVTSTFTDARDAKEYRCVTIGNQTWMAENLAYRLPMGSIEGCFTYLESLVDTGRITPAFDDFKEAFNEAVANGVINADFMTPGMYFQMFLDMTSSIEEYFSTIESQGWNTLFPTEYNICVNLRDGLKPKAIQQAVATNLSRAEEDNSGYSRNHGYLYTYEAAQKAVPEGWRLPTDEDWKQLEAFLGMGDKELDVLDEWRDAGAGRLLKDEHTGFDLTYGGARAYGQFSPHGNNASLFRYINEGTNAYFWSSTRLQQNDSTKVAVIRSLSQWDDRMLRGTSNLTAAYSIRCIKE